MDILIVLDHEDKKKLQKDIEKILVANMQYNFQIYVICNSADLLEVANRYSDKIEILRSCDTAAAIAYLADRVSYDLMLVCTDKSMFNKQKVLKAVALFEKKKKQVEKVEDNVPLVSICIYNYNYGRYLAQCIQSVLDQSYTNIELCISDNDSTDDSWSIICNFAERYPDKLKIIKNSSNKGAG
ncbi:MAG: glycosyltransferase, partial [Chlorobiaceae bacterium]|nr:glycosyltransferase [Chlorobiaceae bacterium]